MKIGQTFHLSAKGRDAISLVGFVRGIDFDNDTTVTVVGSKQKCTCGSVRGHTEDCTSRWQMMEVSGCDGAMVYLSADQIQDIPGAAIMCGRQTSHAYA